MTDSSLSYRDAISSLTSLSAFQLQMFGPLRRPPQELFDYRIFALLEQLKVMETH